MKIFSFRFIIIILAVLLATVATNIIYLHLTAPKQVASIASVNTTSAPTPIPTSVPSLSPSPLPTPAESPAPTEVARVAQGNGTQAAADIAEALAETPPPINGGRIVNDIEGSAIAPSLAEKLAAAIERFNWGLTTESHVQQDESPGKYQIFGMTYATNGIGSTSELYCAVDFRTIIDSYLFLTMINGYSSVEVSIPKINFSETVPFESIHKGDPAYNGDEADFTVLTAEYGDNNFSTYLLLHNSSNQYVCHLSVTWGATDDGGIVPLSAEINPPQN